MSNLKIFLRILIQDGDPWVMAVAIIEMNSNHNRMREIGENGQFSALKRQNKDQIVKDLLTVYNDIIKNHEVL